MKARYIYIYIEEKTCLHLRKFVWPTSDTGEIGETVSKMPTNCAAALLIKIIIIFIYIHAIHTRLFLNFSLVRKKRNTLIRLIKAVRFSYSRLVIPDIRNIADADAYRGYTRELVSCVIPWERVNRIAAPRPRLVRRLERETGGIWGRERTYTHGRIVLIRQRYRKLKFNNRVARVGSRTAAVGPPRIGFRARRIHTGEASERPRNTLHRPFVSRSECEETCRAGKRGSLLYRVQIALVIKVLNFFKHTPHARIYFGIKLRLYLIN